MTDSELNPVIDSLSTLLPVFMRKMHKMRSVLITDKAISGPHVQILFTLYRDGDMNMSALGKKLAFQKSNVSSFIKKLIAQNLVERVIDNNDHRISEIKLVLKGREWIAKYLEEYHNMIRNFVSRLDQKDLTILQNMITSAEYLFLKLDR